MASPPTPMRPSLIKHSYHSATTAEDTSDEGYELTRQPGRTPVVYCDTPSLASQISTSTDDNTTPNAPTWPEAPTATDKIMTMDIPLDDVELAQLFLRADGSVKGLSFNYGDGDLAELGCCVAELDGWFAFADPRWLIVKRAPGRTTSRGFFPAKSVRFADTRAGMGAGTEAIRMKGSLMFRLSPGGLEVGIGLPAAADPLWALEGARETVVRVRAARPAPEPEQSSEDVVGTKAGCKRIVCERARRALKGWIGMKAPLARLSTTIRKMRNRASKATKKSM